MKTLCNNCKQVIESDAEECPYCYKMSYAVIDDDEEINFIEDIKNPIDKLLESII